MILRLPPLVMAIVPWPLPEVPGTLSIMPPAPRLMYSLPALEALRLNVAAPVKEALKVMELTSMVPRSCELTALTLKEPGKTRLVTSPAAGVVGGASLVPRSVNQLVAPLQLVLLPCGVQEKIFACPVLP